MQSYISHPRGTVFYHLINFLSSKSCPIHLLRKISEIIENMIFSLIFVLQEIWYFRQLRKMKKIWHLRWAFLRKCCFSCSVTYLDANNLYGWVMSQYLSYSEFKWLNKKEIDKFDQNLIGKNSLDVYILHVDVYEF